MTRGAKTPPEVALIVIRMKALGEGTKEIARLTGISMRTIRHIVHVFRTTGEYGLKKKSERGYKMSREDVEVGVLDAYYHRRSQLSASHSSRQRESRVSTT